MNNNSLSKCKKCQNIRNNWFSTIVKHWFPVKKKLEIKFNIVFGKEEFNKAYIDGKINFRWQGKCLFCGREHSINI